MFRYKKLAFLLLAVLLVAVPMVVGCAKKEAPAPAPAPAPTKVPYPEFLSIGSNPEGSHNYTLAGPLAKFLQQDLGIKTSVEPGGSSSVWFPLMIKEEIDLGFNPGIEANAAFLGKGPYAQYEGGVPLRWAASGSKIPFTLFTTDPSIKELPDAKGKRLFYLERSFSINAFLDALLAAYGMTRDDLEMVGIGSHTEGKNAIIEGKTDLYFYTLTPWVEEVVRVKPLYGVEIPPAISKKIGELAPGVSSGQWPAGQYGAKETTTQADWLFSLYVREGLDADLVYDILNVLYTRHDELVNTHRYFKLWTPDRGTMAISAEAHPGAVKFWKDKGLWTAEAEATSQSWKQLKAKAK